MITFESQYGPLIDNLLNQFQSDDSKEVNLAIEALQSIVDANHTHIIDDSLKDRVTQIHSLLDKPPVEGLAVEGFKTLVLIKVAAKIQELSKKSLIKAEEVIPAFTNDAKVNAKIYEALLKLRSFEFEQIEQEKGTLQLYTPLEGRSDFDSTEKFDAFAKTKEFLEGSHRCLLLMGDSGAGKTTFAYHLAQTLWQAHEKGFAKNKPIPVLIPLITIEEVEKRLIQEHFGHQGLSPEEIRLLKEHFSFVFILESYDERDCFKNLYQTNRLDGWNCKVITTCRSQSLLNKRENYRSYFSTGQLRDVLQEIILCPFTEKEIKTYIASYVNHHKDEVEWDADLYWKTLSQLPSVLALVTNPFVLKMTVLTLPDIVKRQKQIEVSMEWDATENKIKVSIDKKKAYEKMSLTQAELYDAFIDAWFERQIKKMGGKLKLNDGTLLTSIDFFKFNQDIAIEMLRHKTKYLEFKESQKQMASSLLSSTSTTSSITDWQSAFFNPENEKTTLLRSGWLLKKTGAKTYTFLHDSLRYHFAAKQLFHGILASSSFAFGHPLNEQLIVDQADVINSLADRVIKDSSLEPLLYEIIRASKCDPFVSIAAANAITILCRCGGNLSGQDFSCVRIPGADLSGAYLDTVNFKEADLQGVNFARSFINSADLTGSCMDKVQFGQTIISFQNCVVCCKYSSDGKLIAIGDSEGYVHLYECASSKLAYTINNWSPGQLSANVIRSLSFSGDSKWLAVGSEDSLIRIWNIFLQKEGVISATLMTTLKGHQGVVLSVSFGQEGTLLASGGKDKIIRIWDIFSKKMVHAYSDPQEQIQSVCLSSDGGVVAAGCLDGSIWILSKESGKVLQGHHKSVTSVSFSPDGKTLAVGGNGILLCDVLTGEILWKIRCPNVIFSLGFNPDGRSIASGHSDNSVRIWDAVKGLELRSFEGHLKHVFSVTFDPSGKTVVSGSLDGTVRLWDVSQGEVNDKKLRSTGLETCISLDSQGRALVLGADDGIRLCDWRVINDRIQPSIGHCSSYSLAVSSMSLSPDDKLLAATGGDDNIIRLLDLTIDKDIKTLEGHKGPVISLSFHPDGTLLASGSEDGTARLWDISTRKTLCGFQAPLSIKFTSTGFSPDGKIFAYGYGSSVYGGEVHWVNISTKENLKSWGTIGSLASKTPTGESIESYLVVPSLITFSPDSRFIAVVDLVNNVCLRSLQANMIGIPLFARTCRGHKGAISSITFNPSFPDNPIFVTGGSQEVRLWDINSGQCLHKLGGFIGSNIKICWPTPSSKEVKTQMLITGDSSGAFRFYSLPVDLEKNAPLFLHSTLGTQGLHCDSVTITQVTGLSQQNFELLKKNSSIGQVSQKSSDDILFARDQMETVGDTCNTVFGRSKSGDLYGLTASQWAVSMAHKKENEHAFIILEGIENQKRVIYQAEVFLDSKREAHMFKIPLYGKLGFGYAYVQIKPISTRNAKELAKQTYFRSESITKEQADQLLVLIKKKAESELRYHHLGNSKVYAIAMGNKEYGNCLTFAEEWLKTIEVKFVNEQGWQTTLSPFSITSQRAYFIADNNTGRNPGKCILQ